MFPSSSYYEQEDNPNESYLTDLANYKFYEETIDDDSFYHDIIDDIFATSRLRVESISPDKTLNSINEQDSDDEVLTSSQSVKPLEAKPTTSVAPTKKKNLRYKIFSNTNKLLGKNKSNDSEIDYFVPVVLKSQSSNAFKKIKTLVDKDRIEVATDDKRYDELGLVSYFGNVSKKRGELKKYHARWIIMRGFDIYWFQKPMGLCKGKMALPSLPI